MKLKEKTLRADHFSAQDWLFREFMDKMKRNNVKKILVYTEDAEGNSRSFEWCIPKSKKKIIEFISS